MRGKYAIVVDSVDKLHATCFGWCIESTLLWLIQCELLRLVRGKYAFVVDSVDKLQVASLGALKEHCYG